MCGIFFIKKNENLSTDKVQEEFNKSSYRGPDNTQFYELENYYIGFHRLSINGLNADSNQPFYKNGIYVICNGEIYNYKQLYDTLGIKQCTDSDCEIILDLYTLYPIEYFINLLDGVFSFVIYDTTKDIIIASRDPFGVRPMFCTSDLTCFSSELKQINNLSKSNIIQFPPGHFLVNDKFYRYFTLNQLYSPPINNELTYYQNLVKYNLKYAVKKRLLSDRPIACLLSGGLDSSLITSIVVNLLQIPVETFSIGLPGSTDLKNAKIVASYLKTKHTEILLTEDDFFNAIPEVINKIESYDTTTVRASVGNYLVSKYIAENSNAKVIFNGDGADEVAGGYLYLNNSPNHLLFDYEIKKLLGNIQHFDVLRSDRCISACGLEPRTPFLDKTFVSMYLSIPLYHRFNPEQIEKKLLRDAFVGYLPKEILYRKKEAFSDGVSSENKSWYQIISDKLDSVDIPNFSHNVKYLCPKTKEQIYYRYLFEKDFPGREKIIPYFWMPKWTKSTDPSARTL